jgi:hypothetical protein
MSFNRALRRVTGSTLGLLELYIMQRVARTGFATVAQQFVDQDALGMTESTLEKRIDGFGI